MVHLRLNTWNPPPPPAPYLKPVHAFAVPIWASTALTKFSTPSQCCEPSVWWTVLFLCSFADSFTIQKLSREVQPRARRGLQPQSPYYGYIWAPPPRGPPPEFRQRVSQPNLGVSAARQMHPPRGLGSVFQHQLPRQQSFSSAQHSHHAHRPHPGFQLRGPSHQQAQHDFGPHPGFQPRWSSHQQVRVQHDLGPHPDYKPVPSSPRQTTGQNRIPAQQPSFAVKHQAEPQGRDRPVWNPAQPGVSLWPQRDPPSVRVNQAAQGWPGAPFRQAGQPVERRRPADLALTSTQPLHEAPRSNPGSPQGPHRNPPSVRQNQADQGWPGAPLWRAGQSVERRRPKDLDLSSAQPLHGAQRSSPGSPWSSSSPNHGAQALHGAQRSNPGSPWSQSSPNHEAQPLYGAQRSSPESPRTPSSPNQVAQPLYGAQRSSSESPRTPSSPNQVAQPLHGALRSSPGSPRSLSSPNRLQPVLPALKSDQEFPPLPSSSNQRAEQRVAQDQRRGSYASRLYW